MTIDMRAWDLEMPATYSDEILKAQTLLRSIGWDVVPKVRLRQVTIGGKVEVPNGLPDKKLQEHLAGIYAAYTKHLALEFLKEKMVEINRTPVAGEPGFETVLMQCLVVIPLHSTVATTEGGPRRLGPMMDVGMPKPPEGGWPNGKTDFTALPAPDKDKPDD